MRKIMVFQHVGHEPLGTLDPLLKAAGFRIRYVNFGRTPDLIPSLDSYSGLIVLGGPMGVYEADIYPHLKVEMRLIEEALKRDIPVLGICLGAQLIAATLGAVVKKAGIWEMGWHQLDFTAEGERDVLFSHVRSGEKVFQIHQDTFALPQGAVHLATSPLCSNQAFKYGEKVYGFQFHLEVDSAMILRWLKRPENQQIMQESQGQLNHDDLVRDTELYIPRSLQVSAETFGRFIEMFNLPERKQLLGSGHGKPKKWNE